MEQYLENFQIGIRFSKTMHRHASSKLGRLTCFYNVAVFRSEMCKPVLNAILQKTDVRAQLKRTLKIVFWLGVLRL